MASAWCSSGVLGGISAESTVLERVYQLGRTNILCTRANTIANLRNSGPIVSSRNLRTLACQLVQQCSVEVEASLGLPDFVIEASSPATANLAGARAVLYCPGF